MKTYPFCSNSRRWVLVLDMTGLPKSCPRKGYQGNVSCVGSDCGYYESRKPTKYLKRLLKSLEMEE